jgi:hypothetical protein
MIGKADNGVGEEVIRSPTIWLFLDGLVNNIPHSSFLLSWKRTNAIFIAGLKNRTALAGNNIGDKSLSLTNQANLKRYSQIQLTTLTLLLSR